MRLLAIDPGGTTGLCLIQLDRGWDQFELIESVEFPWLERFHMYDYIRRVGADIHVIEEFRLYRHEAMNQVGSDFPSCQVIGAVEYLLEEKGKRKNLFYQPAYVTKSVAIEKRHEAMVGKDSEHRKDAYKHARYWVLLATNKNDHPNKSILQRVFDSLVPR
jgi:hypothetical protein